MGERAKERKKERGEKTEVMGTKDRERGMGGVMMKEKRKRQKEKQRKSWRRKGGRNKGRKEEGERDGWWYRWRKCEKNDRAREKRKCTVTCRREGGRGEKRCWRKEMWM